jgi:16S rRNA (adenine1518-N6/adenine1519-N6)-dimethyltransferase
VDLNKLILDNKEFDEVIIVSNLPYYITSDILERIIGLQNPKITKIVAMMQKEVGKKLVKKEDKIESYLKVLIDNYCDTSILLYVSKNDFEPRPNVDSVVLGFAINKDLYNLDEESLKLLRDCLNNRRKTLLNTLPFDKQLIVSSLNELKLKETLRIEEINIKQFLQIINSINNNK